MAERTVAVRLAARVDQYVAAMRTASAATGTFATTTQAKLASVGGGMQSLGRTMTLGVTVPIAALGVASTRMAMDFETAFSRLVGLANVPAEEIDGLREAVLDLSGRTAQAPQDLADALYFAASAGLDAADAMDVVTLGAEAAAAGMGDTSTVVDLLSSVVLGYGEANITAAEAADILTEAIRQGKAEPDEMAASLGRVIPVAAQMGIGFDEVAGSVAFLTSTGLDADEAVTALRGTLLALMDPSAQGRQALLDMGTSVEELQAAIDQDGLLGALELLRAHGFAANGEALSALIEDNRAYVGATALLSDASGRLTPILESTADATGALGDAFGTAADTDAFKMRQALADIQAAMVTLGEVLLPIAADIAGAIADVASWFADLPGPVQAVVAAFGGLLAVGGPLLVVAGSIVRNLQTLSAAATLASGGVGALASSLGPLAVVAGVAFAAWKILDGGHLNAGVSIGTTADALDRTTTSLMNEATQAGETQIEIDSLALAHQALSLAIAENADDELTKAMAGFNVAAIEWLDVLTNLRTGLSSTGDQTGFLRQEMELLDSRFGMGREVSSAFLDALDEGSAGLDRFAEQTGISRGEVQAAAEDLQLLETAAIENTGQINEMALNYLNLQSSLGGVNREAVLAAEAIAGNRREGYNAIEVYEQFPAQLAALQAHLADTTTSTEDLTTATGDLGTATEAAGGKIALTADMIKSMVPQTSDLTTKVELLAGQVGIAADKMGLAAPKIFATAEAMKQLPSDAWTKIEALTRAAFTGTDKVAGFTTEVDDLASSGIAAADAMEMLADGFEISRRRIMTGVSNMGVPLMLEWGEIYGEQLRIYTDSARNYIETQDAIHTANLGFAESLADGSTELEGNTEAAITNRAAIIDYSNAILAHTRAQLDAGLSVDEVNAALAENRRGLLLAAEAAGLDTDEVNALLDALGLMPTDIETVIKLSGEELAKRKIEEMLLDMETLDQGVVAEVLAVLEAQGAWAAYDYLVDYINTHSATTKVYANTSYAQAAINNLNGQTVYLNIHGTVRYKAFASGGYFDQPTFGMFGEAGPEVILPLSNPGRMSSLLGMSEVGPKVAAAMAGAWSSGGGGGGGGYSTSSLYVTVNHYGPGETTPAAVVNALRQYERQRGPIPISVR